jgi:2-oxoglutarate ferredoxin oxidoreductase subunit delta
LAEVTVFEELCKGVEECGICIEVCPQELFRPADHLNRKGYKPPRVENPEACTRCQNCMIYCPDLAVAVEPKKSGKGGGT